MSAEELGWRWKPNSMKVAARKAGNSAAVGRNEVTWEGGELSRGAPG